MQETNAMDPTTVLWVTALLSPGFPHGIESIEFQIWFSRPWKSIEYGQNVH